MEDQPATRPLLVLDLDETLWHGVSDIGAPDVFRFLLRPHLQAFLESVSQQYDLAVWTAASEDWMRAGLQTIFAETHFNLAERAFFLWHRERCTWRRNEQGEYELRKPARKFKAKWIRSSYPPQRILAVDDLASNYRCGYGHLIRVQTWTGDPEDHELQVLAAYLNVIATEPDFRRLEKRQWRSRLNQQSLDDSA